MPGHRGGAAGKSAFKEKAETGSHLDGSSDGKSAATAGTLVPGAGSLGKRDPLAKLDTADKSGVHADNLGLQMKAAGIVPGGILPGGAKDLTGAKAVDIAKGVGGIELAVGERLPDELKDEAAEKGEIADDLDAAEPGGGKLGELDEKGKKKKEDDESDDTTFTTRSAMMAALLNDKSKQEAGGKEEQLATNDSKKKGEDKRRRYVVKDKDNLESIAKKQLRDVRLAALIYEINKHMLPLRMEKGKQVAEPRAGTSIWLPSDADIRDFRGRLYSNAPEWRCAGWLPEERGGTCQSEVRLPKKN